LVQRFDRVENLDTNPTVWNKLAVVSSPGNGPSVKFHEALVEKVVGPESW
jgi:hypothetical protein